MMMYVNVRDQHESCHKNMNINNVIIKLFIVLISTGTFI